MKKRIFVCTVAAAALLSIAGCGTDEIEIQSWEDSNVEASIQYNPSEESNKSGTEDVKDNAIAGEGDSAEDVQDE